MFFEMLMRLLFVGGLLHVPQGYWAFRLFRGIGGATRARRGLRIAAMLVLFVLQLPWFSMFFMRTESLGPFAGPAPALLRVPSAIWALGALAAFLAVVGLRALGWLARAASMGRSEATAVDATRRRLLELTTSGLTVAPWLIVARGVQAARASHRVERVTVPVPGLPEALDGFRIVQLTDVHVSEDMPPALIERFVEIANGLDPDLGVLTGDYLALDQWGLEECVATLSQLHTRAGILGCLGNHEIHSEACDRITQAFEHRGVDILRGEARDVAWRGETLRVVGVDYQRTGEAPRPGVEELLSAGRPNVLLSHNPNAFPHAAELGFDLTIAGHTHGGQVRVEILEKEISPAVFMTPFVQGLYRRGASHLYVSRGIGTTGLPIRLGAPPEVTLITLRRQRGTGLSSESQP